MEEKILKKEGVSYRKGLTKPSGSLVLTPLELYFSVKKGFINKTDDKILSIPIGDILNVRAKKAFGYGIELLEITYSAKKESKARANR